jgi:hypothetical protein
VFFDFQVPPGREKFPVVPGGNLSRIIVEIPTLKRWATLGCNPKMNARSTSKFFAGPALVFYLAGLKLLFHLFTAGRYGIFRDELYYLACGEHLGWGYVDQPPLIALVAWIARHIFGDWLVGLRFFPALAGAATVWLTVFPGAMAAVTANISKVSKSLVMSSIPTRAATSTSIFSCVGDLRAICGPRGRE